MNLTLNTHTRRQPMPRRTTTTPLRLGLVAASAALATAGFAAAATLTWDIAGPTDTWSLTTGNANWLPGPVEWTDDNAAVFDAATGEAITISGTVSPTSVTVGANDGNWSFTGSGSIGGSSTLTKSGTGTLTISTANTYSGTTTISAGILNIQNNTALGSTAGSTSITSGAALQLQGGITVTGETLALNGAGISNGGALRNISGSNEWAGTINAQAGGIGSRLNVDAGSLTLSGSLIVNGSGASFNITNNGTLTISGAISGATGGFSVGGTGTTVISGANTFGDSTHGMTINNGAATVRVTDSTVYGAGNQTITTNGLGNSSNIVTFGANTGSSILQLRANGQNDSSSQTLTYGNNLVISGASGVNGTIDVDRESGTGTNKTLALGNVTTGANGGTLHVTGANGYSLAVGAVTIGGNSKTAKFNPTTANLTIASVTNTSAGTGANRLLLDGTSTGSKVTGVISDGTTYATNVQKDGAGTWTLQGNSTYDGTTLVNVGTLVVNGDNSAANGAVTVANTATLGGSGIIGGATTVNSGGKLAPGTSPGTLTFNSNLSLTGGVGTAGATAIFEGGDLVDVNGTLTLNDGWNLTLTTGYQDGGTTTLFTYTTAGGTLDLTPDFDITALGFTPSGTLTLTDTGSSIVLNGISVVPEPAALALLCLGAVGLLRRRNG
ncbi:MAG: autotransporter-associated beta strand repeat-containing protein [Lentisphaeria bacterium]|jgi:autotransporter-associated beta strand protein